MLNISYPNIMECSRGSKGIELQLEAEQNTHLIAKPYPQFIPTIVYNKVKIGLNLLIFFSDLLVILSIRNLID